MVWQVGGSAGEVRLGAVCYVVAGQVRHGMAWCGRVRFGRQGMVGDGWAGSGRAGAARSGVARHDGAGHGWAGVAC